MINLENVNFKYKNSNMILENINLNINNNEIIAIIGKNGSGKSTLLNLLAGIFFAKSGKIFYDNLEINKHTKTNLVRRKAGIVFQNPDLQIIFSSIYEDLAFILNNLNIDKKEHKELISNALKIVGLDGFESKNPFELSLGQKQRIAIAGAIVSNPEILLFDEVTSMLDNEGKENIYRLIKKLNSNGKTIIFTTNILKEILLSDRILILGENKIENIITPKKIIDDPAILKDYGFNVPFEIELRHLLKIENNQSDEEILEGVRRLI